MWAKHLVGENPIFSLRKSNKIQQYQRHPYILSKRPNVVWISLSPNICPSYNVSHTFPHFSQMLEKLSFSLTTMHFQCQNILILSHLSELFDVPAGCCRIMDSMFTFVSCLHFLSYFSLKIQPDIANLIEIIFFWCHSVHKMYLCVYKCRRIFTGADGS